MIRRIPQRRTTSGRPPRNISELIKVGDREIHEVVLSYTRAEPLSRNAVLKSPFMLTLDLRVRVLTAPI